MLFSKAQQAAMNMTADVLSEAKVDSEKHGSAYNEKEVVYLLNDVALKVKVSVETIDVVRE